MVETSEVIGYIIGIAGVIIGIVGVALAVYSIIKQQKLEQRLKEKEKLKALSKEIQTGLIPRINKIIGNINGPTNNVDTFFDLQNLSQDIVSKAFDEKKDTVRVNTEIGVYLEEGTKDKKDNKGMGTRFTVSNENKEYIP